MYKYVYSCVHMVARAGCGVLLSFSLLPILLRPGLSLNMELGWHPVDHGDPPIALGLQCACEHTDTSLVMLWI